MKKYCTIPALLLLALLGLTGCVSSDRMVRNSPLGNDWSLDMNGSRVNLWPLYYAEGDQHSVLAPLMDFDRRGFAIRPIFHVDGDNYGILWPLCGFDRTSGWFGPMLWGDNYFGVPLLAFQRRNWWNIGPVVFSDRAGGLIPVCWFSRKWGYFIPAWYAREGKEFGFFPLLIHTKSTTQIVNFFKWRDDGWLLFPIAGKGDDWFYCVNYLQGDDWHAALPLYWCQKTDYRSRFFSLPVSWGLRDGALDWLNLGGLLYQYDSGAHHVLLPFGRIDCSERGGANYFFPIFRHNPRGMAGMFFLLDMYGTSDTGGRGWSILYPILYGSNEKDNPWREAQLPAHKNHLTAVSDLRSDYFYKTSSHLALLGLYSDETKLIHAWSNRYSTAWTKALTRAVSEYEKALAANRETPFEIQTSDLKLRQQRLREMEKKSPALARKRNKLEGILRAMQFHISPQELEDMSELRQLIIRDACETREYTENRLFYGALWKSETFGDEYSRKLLFGFLMRDIQLKTQEEFSILRHLYRYQRDGLRSRRSFFPFITQEHSPEGSKWSFCWRLLESHDLDGQRGGHIFFIPWGDAEKR